MPSKSTEKKKRTTRTPRERAEAALGVAQRALDKATARRDAATTELQAAEADVLALAKRVNFLAQDPALETEAVSEEEPTATPPHPDVAAGGE